MHMLHDNEHSCIYIYIYIYIYMDVCGGSLCVMGGRQYYLRLLFCVLARRPHKKLCPREPARLEKKTKDVGQLGVRFRRIRYSELRTQGWSVGTKTLTQSSQGAV